MRLDYLWISMATTYAVGGVSEDSIYSTLADLPSRSLQGLRSPVGVKPESGETDFVVIAAMEGNGFTFGIDCQIDSGGVAVHVLQRANEKMVRSLGNGIFDASALTLISPVDAFVSTVAPDCSAMRLICSICLCRAVA